MSLILPLLHICLCWLLVILSSLTFIHSAVASDARCWVCSSSQKLSQVIDDSSLIETTLGLCCFLKCLTWARTKKMITLQWVYWSCSAESCSYPVPALSLKTIAPVSQMWPFVKDLLVNRSHICFSVCCIKLTLCVDECGERRWQKPFIFPSKRAVEGKSLIGVMCKIQADISALNRPAVVLNQIANLSFFC